MGRAKSSQHAAGPDKSRAAAQKEMTQMFKSRDEAIAQRRAALPALEEEWVAADKTAPRENTVSTPAAHHPGHNEDRVVCSVEHGTAAVFDGMGGQEGGELASRVASGVYASALPDLLDPNTNRHDWLLRAAREASDAINVSKELHRDEAPNQGATMAAVVLDGEQAHVLHVADARVYRWHAGQLDRLTHDRGLGAFQDEKYLQGLDVMDGASSVQDLADEPYLQHAFKHRNIISSELSLERSFGAETVPASRGDWFIVCSDGVHDNLTHNEFAAVLAQTTDPQDAAVKLEAAARARSADEAHFRAKDDDITVAVLPVS